MSPLPPDRGLDNPLLSDSSPEEIISALVLSEDGPRATVENLLQLPHVEDSAWRRLEDAFAHLQQILEVTPEPNDLFLRAKGAIGFALMTNALEAAAANERSGSDAVSENRDSASSDERDSHEPAAGPPETTITDEQNRSRLVAQADHYFEDPDVAATVVSIYGIPKHFDFEEATIHTVGTTSFIVKGAEGSYRGQTPAVKCLLYRYFFVPSITQSTATYADRYRAKTKHAPTVWSSSPLFVAMSFEPGETLAHHLSRPVVRLPGDPEDGLTRTTLAHLGPLSSELCSILAELYHQNVVHLDLSTTNVMVRSRDLNSDPLELALLDFGQNYIVSERLASSAASQRAAVYVAPEVAEHRRATWRADAYSLGVILLEMATGRPLDKEDILPALEHLWVDAPGLARTLEDLLDADPAHRLLLLSDEELETPFESLATRLHGELSVIKSFVTRTKTTGRQATIRGKHLFRALKEWRAVRDVAEELGDGADEDYRHFAVLANWAALSLLLWYVTLFSFIVLTFADLHFNALQGWETHVLRVTHARFTIGRFWHNLPGRLVPLTFALTAVTYYNNIFAPITTRSVSHHLARWSEFFMRSTSFGLYIAILWAMLWAPQAWPLCSGIGTMLVVFNNFFVWRLAVRADDVTHSDRADNKSIFSTRTEDSDRFVAEFSEWFRLMGAYSGFMTLLGVLLLTHVAKDQAIFAYIICFINVFKMYRLNCVIKAPMARGGFERVLTTLRRAERVHPK